MSHLDAMDQYLMEGDEFKYETAAPSSVLDIVKLTKSNYKFLKEFQDQHLALVGIKCMPIEGKKAFLKDWGKGRAGTGSFMPHFEDAHNIGIFTGAVNGITVLDIDVKDAGMDVWTEMVRANDIGKPYIVRTGGGGLHLYYKYDPS